MHLYSIKGDFMKKIIIVLLAILVICSLVVSAAPSHLIAKNRKQIVEPPQIKVGMPREGQTVIGNAITVQVTSSNTKIKQAAPKNRDKEAHLLVWVDSTKPVKQFMTTFRLNIATLSEGKHTLNVELVQNDGTSFSPAVKRAVQFSVIRSAVKGGNQPREVKIFHPSRLFTNARI